MPRSKKNKSTNSQPKTDNTSINAPNKDTQTLEPEPDNSDLKNRLASAKQRLEKVQEVINKLDSLDPGKKTQNNIFKPEIEATIEKQVPCKETNIIPVSKAGQNENIATTINTFDEQNQLNTETKSKKKKNRNKQKNKSNETADISKLPENIVNLPENIQSVEDVQKLQIVETETKVINNQSNQTPNLKCESQVELTKEQSGTMSKKKNKKNRNKTISEPSEITVSDCNNKQINDLNPVLNVAKNETHMVEPEPVAATVKNVADCKEQSSSVILEETSIHELNISPQKENTKCEPNLSKTNQEKHDEGNACAAIWNILDASSNTVHNETSTKNKKKQKRNKQQSVVTKESLDSKIEQTDLNSEIKLINELNEKTTHPLLCDNVLVEATIQNPLNLKSNIDSNQLVQLSEAANYIEKEVKTESIELENKINENNKAQCLKEKATTLENKIKLESIENDKIKTNLNDQKSAKNKHKEKKHKPGVNITSFQEASSELHKEPNNQLMINESSVTKTMDETNLLDVTKSNIQESKLNPKHCAQHPEENKNKLSETESTIEKAVKTESIELKSTINKDAQCSEENLNELTDKATTLKHEIKTGPIEKDKMKCKDPKPASKIKQNEKKHKPDSLQQTSCELHKETNNQIQTDKGNMSSNLNTNTPNKVGKNEDPNVSSTLNEIGSKEVLLSQPLTKDNISQSEQKESFNENYSLNNKNTAVDLDSKKTQTEIKTDKSAAQIVDTDKNKRKKGIKPNPIENISLSKEDCSELIQLNTPTQLDEASLKPIIINEERVAEKEKEDQQTKILPKQKEEAMISNDPLFNTKSKPTEVITHLPTKEAVITATKQQRSPKKSKGQVQPKVQLPTKEAEMIATKQQISPIESENEQDNIQQPKETEIIVNKQQSGPKESENQVQLSAKDTEIIVTKQRTSPKELENLVQPNIQLPAKEAEIIVTNQQTSPKVSENPVQVNLQEKSKSSKTNGQKLKNNKQKDKIQQNQKLNSPSNAKTAEIIQQTNVEDVTKIDNISEKSDLNQKDEPPEPDIPISNKSLDSSEIQTIVKSLDEESLDTDSKNLQGSDFVQSVESSSTSTDDAKSLASIVTPSLESLTETFRNEKNISPTTNKRNKNLANKNQMENTLQEQPKDLTVQEKMTSSQISTVQLLDILETKMSKPEKNILTNTGAIRKNKKELSKIGNAAASSLTDTPVIVNALSSESSSSNKIKLQKSKNCNKIDKEIEEKLSKKLTEILSSSSENKTETKISLVDILTSVNGLLTNKTNAENQATKKISSPPPIKVPPPVPNGLDYEDDEDFIEYKFSPRQVFVSTVCHVCKASFKQLLPCKLCQMISYCSEKHLEEDKEVHGDFCSAIQEIAKKRGGHIYNNAKILTNDDYRCLRVHTINICETALKRQLQPFEREILLFPRMCNLGTCRQWRFKKLKECSLCGQCSYCEANPDHLPDTHTNWCKSFELYTKLVIKQKNYGRIEPSLPSKIMPKNYTMASTMDKVFKDLYKNYNALKDECTYATLTQLATAPLTAYYSMERCQQEIGENYTIHLVGAELQFEADTLDKWEAFFLHLVPKLVQLNVVFIGPELNTEKLPLEILSRIRMCRLCRQECRVVKFDFQCGKLYHEYVKSSGFVKPNLVCFFNAGLYRSTGFNGMDTWPDTIKSALSLNCPLVVTSYTEMESPKDLERIQKDVEQEIMIIQCPIANPYTSQRPERNFISDEISPMIFKNYYCFIVKPK